MIKIIYGDCRNTIKQIQNESVQCVVTSPPYWGLRSYLPKGHANKNLEIGQEKSPQEYVSTMVELFSEIHRTLKPDGTVWLNLGDCFARTAGDDSKKQTDQNFKTGRTGNSKILFKEGNNKPPLGLKSKDLIGIPWRVAFGLQESGWYLRSDIIWSKPNPMPESVCDRPTRSHEYIFLLTKSEKYYYNSDAIRERPSPIV